MNKKYLKLLILFGIAITLIVIYQTKLNVFFNLEFLKANIDALINWYQSDSVFFIFILAIITILCIAFSLPVVALLALASGAIIGPLYGGVLVSLFSVIGASLSFLIARYIFRAELEKKYQNKVNTINKGLHKNLWNYLFFIRIAAVFPFFIVNIVLGLSRVSLKNFFISTFIGMLPVIFIYAFAGRQLVQLNSLKDVFSFNILIVFFLFGLLLLAPIILKKITRKIYK
ncbi:TVP38/TMEM64 family protein [bacterium]|jgi:uncharacterized membrane protein YdjX (TVP38/TMEM64 family)|nr:TVP38/TMEM64 family protein [bacterium]MBT3580773.1 TVP38/TMEM64 family protein [bacterium]MBT4551624.1 TVP38/TMEM64 family protein [bacterium]MBT5988744.1 TVP38/TMEM64 family protein [bacterium]